MLACVLVINMMPGGAVLPHTALVDALTATGCTARIEGSCASACTVLLDVPGVCVSPGATLMFHGVKNTYGLLPMSDVDFDFWSQELASHYPRRIAKWYLAEGRYGQHWMTGREAIRLGARECE